MHKSKVVRGILSAAVLIGGLWTVAAIAQDILAQDISDQIQAAAYDPQVAATVIHTAVKQHPSQVSMIVKTAIEAAPHFTTTLTAAAVEAARDQLATIRHAALRALPAQGFEIVLATDIASQLVANPGRDTLIVSDAIKKTPDSLLTIVTAAVTVCRFADGCSKQTPMPIVHTAVKADQSTSEAVVEVAVSQFPAIATDIIAAATQAWDTPTAQVASYSGSANDINRFSGATEADVVLPAVPAPSDFPGEPGLGGVGGGSGSGSGTGTGTGTPSLPPLYPASPFF